LYSLVVNQEDTLMSKQVRISIKALALAAGLAACIDVNMAMAQVANAQSGNFQGAYVGAHVGAGSGRAGAASTSGVVGGGQIGANAQFGKVVVGAEADISASSIGNKGFTDKYRQGTTGSLRGRAGYAFDQVLVYGTAGAAMTSSEWKNRAGTTDKTLTGFVYGAGAEVQMNRNISLRGEVLRYDFGRETYVSTLGPVSMKPGNTVGRAGVNYRF
jgi:outer membrane immunogenic protein